ncbi:hypothetical protein [Xanthobacter sediminis]
MDLPDSSLPSPRRLTLPPTEATASPGPLRRGLARFWSRVLDLGLVLWVVRIPLLSVAVGLLLMLSVTQAQDTLVDVAMAGAPLAEKAGFSGAVAGLVAATFLLWAIPVHYAARLLVETDDGLAALARRRDAEASPRDAWTRFVIRQVPRLLGALTFVAFAIGAEKAVANLPTLTDDAVSVAARGQLHLIAATMAIAAPAFFLYAVLRSRLTRIGPFRAVDTALGRLCAGLFRLLGIAPRTSNPDGELHATGRLLLLAYAAGVILILIANPLWLARQLPLAFAVPLIFGGWVPIFSYLSSIGRRFRFPFVTALLALSAGGVYLFGDNHKVRTLVAAAPSYQRTGIDTAVFLWMRANGCAEAPATCPRPIIVAAAGGASRAGFFTASVIGHFLDFAQHHDAFTLTRADGSKLVRGAWDDGRITPEAAQALAGVDIANRIFAISGVSGGAYGAAVTAAALGARTGHATPCAGGAQPYWFGGGIATWQDCLESLTGGDYLTATFFGLAFHDQVQAFLEDRAALLEQAWERRFADIATTGDAAAPWRLARPFLAAERDPARWVPFLVLNGTSVETGQRIITTDLQPTYAARRPCPSGGPQAECPLFTHAIDFHALVRADLDVRLSTAALNSARFPAISPPGSIFQADKDVVDRIVDGGYFENYGAESALELAQAMVDVAPGLAPFVVVISNDPQSTLTEERTARGVVVPDAPEHVWLAEVTGPIDAISTVRGGRGRLAVTETSYWLNARFGVRCRDNLANIKVWPEALDGTCPIGVATPKKIRDVSMSWWLSKPVQMNLREQLEHTSDRCNNDAAVAAVWQALATPSAACVPER